ncbi:hypothetical protein B0H14DRAFT_2603742 [Mycena olivaceomarginata]|nr:hypothetical protein B0H14DRAFT_2603742 [Mycena olivaceomarginata]
MKILSEIFALRRTLSDYKQWLRIRFSNGPRSGLDLARGKSSHRVQPSDREGNLCWWPLDPNWQSKADPIVRLGRIYNIRQKTNLHQYEATCITSQGSLNDPNHLRYSNYIHRNGYAACSCRDFMSRRAACKHLRLLRLVLDHWVSWGHIELLGASKDLGEDSTANNDDKGISQEDIRLESEEDSNENNWPTVPNVKLTRAVPLTELHETLGNIQLNLTKALPPLPPPPLTIPPPAVVRSSSPSISQPQPAYTSTGALVVGIKCPAAAMILAPSPEPHQRRKPSHSIL